MPTVVEVVRCLQRLAPLELAESWDNVGLLVGDSERPVQRIMTCLTLSPDVVDEAAREQVNLIVTHHPLMFRKIQRITADSPDGRVLLQLIESKIAVYSSHTGYDSAAGGINQQLSELLELRDIAPLRPAECTVPPHLANPEATELENFAAPLAGAGRYGTLKSPERLADFLERVKRTLSVTRLQYVGDDEMQIQRVAVACGSAAEFATDATQRGCDLLLTGESRFHSCLEGRTNGLAMILTGHYASERFAMEQMARMLQESFPDTRVWASTNESDPIRWC